MDYSFVDVSKKRDTTAVEIHLFVIVCNRKYCSSFSIQSKFFWGVHSTTVS